MKKLLPGWFLMFLFAFRCFLPSGAFASGGQRPNAYTEYGVGGAPEAMAGAAVGLRNDPSCGFWNPAGLTAVKNIQIEAQNSFLSLNQSLDYYSFSANLQDSVYCGLSLLAYSAGNDLEVRNGNSMNPDSILSDAEYTGLLSGAFRLSPHWAGGFNLKLLLNNLGNVQSANGTGFGFDTGLQYRVDNDTTIGLVVQDPYTVFTYQDSFSTVIPTTFRWGMNRREESLRGNWAFDLEWSQDLGFQPRLGAEWFPFEVLALRAGVWAGGLNSGDNGVGPTLNLTCGLGILIPLRKSFVPRQSGVDQIIIDYSLIPDPQQPGAVLNQIAASGKFM